jgi:adiponectin receptor
MSNQLSEIQSQFKNEIQHQLTELESLKDDYENVFIPYILNEIKIKIDPEYLEQITNKLNKIKETLDSSTYDYVELKRKMPNPHQVSRWPVVIFLFSAAICLLCSTTFHLFYPMSGSNSSLILRCIPYILSS